ncbi:MAG: TIGR02444 family protein [Rhizobiales bacterium]|nr:TIGR02444 family protein [Hyphomicrobiales bacterium]
MSAIETRSFWDYSLALYDHEPVREALLALQDAHGLEINLLLLCVYAAACGEDPFSEAEMEGLVRIGTKWGREVVAPLRLSRRALKAMADDADVADLIAHIKALELEAEKAMQIALVSECGQRAAYVNETSARRLSAQGSFTAYLAVAGKPLTPDCEETFADVLDVAF